MKLTEAKQQFISNWGAFGTHWGINRTMAQIVGSPGSTRRLTVSVAVDGLYENDSASGKRIYKPRSSEEIQILTQLVRNAVGYSQERNDDVYVASVQFDRTQFEDDLAQLEKMEDKELWETWALRLTLVFVVLLAFVFLRKVALSVIEAMNPPVPRYAGIAIEAEQDEVPETVRRQNELVDKLEEWSIANPDSVANLLRIWLSEGNETQKKKK